MLKPLWKTVVQFLNKLNMQLFNCHVTQELHPGTYWIAMKIHSHTTARAYLFVAASLVILKSWILNKWLVKQSVVFPHHRMQQYKGMYCKYTYCLRWVSRKIILIEKGQFQKFAYWETIHAAFLKWQYLEIH